VQGDVDALAALLREPDADSNGRRAGRLFEAPHRGHAHVVGVLLIHPGN
jgi:hypothetical protein